MIKVNKTFIRYCIHHHQRVTYTAPLVGLGTEYLFL